MFVSNDFIFIHIPKTGGTFITTILKELYKNTNKYHFDTHGHDRYCYITHGLIESDIPILSCIRNPFDWYVSHYKMGWWKNADQFCYIPDVKKVYPSFPDLSFKEFIKFYNDYNYIDYNFHQKGWMGFYTKSLIDQLSKRPYNYIYKTIDTDERYFVRNLPSNFSFIRCENLNNDLNLFLTTYFNLDEIKFILDREKIYPLNNQTREDNDRWQNYYDEESRKFIVEKEMYIFSHFGYEKEIK